VIPTVFKKV